MRRMMQVAVLVVAAGRPASAADVSVPLQDKIETAMAPNFIMPETSVWRFDDVSPYVGGDSVVCGWVNYQSAQHKYMGFHQFYAIVHADTIPLAQLDDPREDTSGALAEKLKSVCGHTGK